MPLPGKVLWRGIWVFTSKISIKIDKNWQFFRKKGQGYRTRLKKFRYFSGFYAFSTEKKPPFLAILPPKMLDFVQKMVVFSQKKWKYVLLLRKRGTKIKVCAICMVFWKRGSNRGFYVIKKTRILPINPSFLGQNRPFWGQKPPFLPEDSL